MVKSPLPADGSKYFGKSLLLLVRWALPDNLSFGTAFNDIFKRFVA
jgi:hypothetical protein